MLTGAPPWSNISRNVRGVLELISSTTNPPDFPSGVSSECVSFLKRCLCVDPTERATAKELLLHPFVTKQMITKEEESVITSEIEMNPPPRPVFSYREGEMFDSREVTSKNLNFSLGKI
jgi:serine/threonine protein kinase